MALLKHGLDINNEIVSINDVTSGLGCNCKCPSCGEKLVAKKGDIKQWHFAHNSNESCEYAEQTAVHLIAKDIIAKHGVFLPEALFEYELKDELSKLERHKLIKQSIITKTGCHITFNNVHIEKKIGNIIPDIIAEYNGVTILIEIAVTHFIDAAKLEKLKDLGLPCLEINCSHLRDSENLEEDLIDFLLKTDKFKSSLFAKCHSDAHFRKWIISPSCSIINSSSVKSKINKIRYKADNIVSLRNQIIDIEKTAKYYYSKQKAVEIYGIKVYDFNTIIIKNPVNYSIAIFKDTHKEVDGNSIWESIYFEDNIFSSNECVKKADIWLLNYFKQTACEAYKELEQAKIELANLEKDYNPEIEVIIKCEI